MWEGNVLSLFVILFTGGVHHPIILSSAPSHGWGRGTSPPGWGRAYTFIYSPHLYVPRWRYASSVHAGGHSCLESLLVKDKPPACLPSYDAMGLRGGGLGPVLARGNGVLKSESLYTSGLGPTRWTHTTENSTSYTGVTNNDGHLIRNLNAPFETNISLTSECWNFP